MTTTATLAQSEPTTSTSTASNAQASAPRGHIGRIVTTTILGGAIAATIAVIGPLAGAEEHVITGTVLAVFATAWALLARLSLRWTDQPQRWASVPAAVMAAAAAFLLAVAPTGNEAGWLWPPAALVLAVWMAVQSRRHLRSRARTLVLYPVFAALALASIGGAYETYRETADTVAAAMPGRLVDVGGHRLHIDCTGSGSPTVVLEAGMGEVSPMMAAWIAPNVAGTTRVCVYDRAGRGWSDSADRPQDGEEVATDLHTLLANASEPGPFVVAGHSAGGIYTLNFARLFPTDVAGVVLLDSMHPDQYELLPSWPGFYEMYRRASAVMPSLSRFGVSRLINDAQYGDLPATQRDQERELLSTPAHNRSVRDEFNQIRTALSQAAQLNSLGDLPLAVVTAERDAEPEWFTMQSDLATLSTNSAHTTLSDANHQMVVADEDTAHQASDAILDVVNAVRSSTPLHTEAG
ncbi:MAG: alpha/beta fold hydrolase [Acidimicrobiales bacterium]